MNAVRWFMSRGGSRLVSKVVIGDRGIAGSNAS